MNKKYLFLLFGFVLVSFSFIEFNELNKEKLSGCSYNKVKNKLAVINAPGKSYRITALKPITDSVDYERQFKLGGLVNMADVDSTIRIDLRYSSVHNFTGRDMYGSLNKAYLQKEAAEKLTRAQQQLKKRFPYYHLKILDAARPLSIQKKLWEKLELPFAEKINYLSNPSGKGSLHNYGVAVDITIADEGDIEIDMGSAYDTFNPALSAEDNKSLLAAGKLTYRQFDNRQLLRGIMCSAGFYPIPTEWWHFNACGMATAQAKYKLL